MPRHTAISIAAAVVSLSSAMQGDALAAVRLCKSPLSVS
jgi:hypothetical protein